MQQLSKICFLLIVFKLTSVNAQDNIIIWEEGYKLCWNDFNGTPETNEIYNDIDLNAMSSIGITFNMDTNKSINERVIAYFIKSESWTADTTTTLLEHEQIHFDIAELFARKLRKRIHELELQGIRNQVDIWVHFKYFEKEMITTQKTYDLETLHGVIGIKQKKWENKILEELSSYSDFAPNYPPRKDF